jgi:hypothetical protein
MAIKVDTVAMLPLASLITQSAMRRSLLGASAADRTLPPTTEDRAEALRLDHAHQANADPGAGAQLHSPSAPAGVGRHLAA